MLKKSQKGEVAYRPPGGCLEIAFSDRMDTGLKEGAVGMVSPMRRGLKLVYLHQLSQPMPSRKMFPDEKGIETCVMAVIVAISFSSRKMFPDEKGIETAQQQDNNTCIE